MTGSDRFTVAPDGSPILLYRRLKAGAEPDIVRRFVRPGGAILELGAGAGRVTRPLLELGYRVVAVDESAEMLRSIHDAETVRTSIEDLALGRRFDAVLLGSHLVNTANYEQRHAFLTTCRRHVADDGVVLLEHHPADWTVTVRPMRSERDGVVLSLTDVRVEGPYVSALMVYEIDRQIFRQPFTARILGRAELAEQMAAAGLWLHDQINEHWSVAIPASA